MRRGIEVEDAIGLPEPDRPEDDGLRAVCPSSHVPTKSREGAGQISLDDDPAFRQTVFDATGGWTMPQILIDDEPIGGYTELWRLDREGRLEELVAA